MKDLFFKAMDNAREGITISDATRPDNPLIYVNKGFMIMTGYTFEESVGKNCRYLQGAETAPEQVELIRSAISKREPVQLELINYKKNGETFWNYFSLTPITNDEGIITNFIGIQEDITAKKQQSLLQEQLNRTKLIAQATIRGQEEERAEIGRELHDNINQMVATISLYMDIAVKKEAQRMDMIDRTKALTRQIIEETRKFSKALVGPAFEQVSFKAALREMVASIQIAISSKIIIIDECLDEPRLSKNQKLVLFRIVQEQLNNILKYAKAGQVVIHASSGESGIDLSIKDDGVGFDTEAYRQGIGLRNMSNRLEVENGSLKIVSSPGKGCELVVWIPLEVQPAEMSTRMLIQAK